MLTPSCAQISTSSAHLIKWCKCSTCNHHWRQCRFSFSCILASTRGIHRCGITARQGRHPCQALVHHSPIHYVDGTPAHACCSSALATGNSGSYRMGATTRWSRAMTCCMVPLVACCARVAKKHMIVTSLSQHRDAESQAVAAACDSQLVQVQCNCMN
jgi:hypothetical protein